MGVRPAGVKSSRGDALGGQSFPDEEHNSEGFLDDPMAKIEHAQSDKNREAEKRQELIAPFHSVERAERAGVVNPGAMGNRLSAEPGAGRMQPWPGQSFW